MTSTKLEPINNEINQIRQFLKNNSCLHEFKKYYLLRKDTNTDCKLKIY